MAVQKEEAVIDITVNKKAAQMNVDELDAKIKSLTSSLKKMHQADDPQLYEGRIRALQQAKAQRDAEKAVIDGETIALKKFQQAFIDGQKTVEVAAANNPVKKFAVEARTEFESFSNSVSKSPVGNQLKNIKSILSGSDATSSPFFTYVVTGFKTASTAVDNHKSKLDALRAAQYENVVAQQKLQEALEATTAEQEAVNAQLIANKAAQEEAAAAVAAATTLDEAEAAAIAHKKLVQEESNLTTKAQILAENEATIATEAQIVAQEGLTLATSQGSGAMRIFKLALAGTGIGLFIVAIASLVAYFAETNEGSKKFQVIMAQLNALFQECMKVLAPIGKAIFDTFSQSEGPLMLFTAAIKNALIPMATLFKVITDVKNGSFKQAFLDIRDGMKEWSDNGVDLAHGLITTTVDLTANLGKASDAIKKVNTDFAGAAKSAKDVTVARQELTKAERIWSEEKTKQIGQVALLTKQLRDQNLGEQERVALAEKAKSIREGIYQNDYALAVKNEQLVEKEQSLRSKVDYQAITDAKNRVQEVTNAYLNQDQLITNRESSLNKRQLTREQKNQQEYDKLIKMAQSFHTASEVDNTSANEKEIAAVEKKYDTLIDKLKEFQKRKGLTEKESAGASKMIAAAEAEKTKEVADTRAKQLDTLNSKIKAFHQQIADVQASAQEKELDRINTFYNAQLVLAGNNEDQKKAIEQARTEDIATAKVDEAKRLQLELLSIEEEGATTDEEKQKVKLARINQHYDDELEALKKKFSKELQATQEFKNAEIKILSNKAKAIAVVGDTSGQSEEEKANVAKLKKQSELEKKFAQETANSIFTINNRSRQAETDGQIRALEIQADAQLKDKRLTADQKQAIEEKLAKDEAAVKLAAWKADQKAAMEQAVINGALAMTKVSAQTGILSFAWDPIIALETAAQVAIIASQPAPQFAKGGVITGPSHANNGVPLIDGNTGKAIAEVEGDETVAVFSKESTKNNGALINQLLFNSMYRNGAKVDVGGIGNGVKLEKGGPLAVSAAGQSGSGMSTTHITKDVDIDALVDEMRLMRKAFKDQKVKLYRNELSKFDDNEAVTLERATL